ncbi:MAG: hypothetical protein CSA65_00155 [Proteobacteria bacterium]|nr:MAG: hypothetical protein CSA65_00155 [Pseudomonadota bacterium]
MLLAGALTTLAACPSNVIYPDAGSEGGTADDLVRMDSPLELDLNGPFIPTEPIETKISVANGTALAENFKTINPGEGLSFKAEAICPEGATCKLKWDFGNGQTANTLDGGTQTFPKGYYHVRFTVSNINDDVLGEAHAYIAAWDGEFSDDFNRASVEWDKYGWVKPVQRDVEYVIKDDWLYLEHDHRAPGSTGLTASPLMHDAHAEVTVRRYPHGTEIHYMDVLFRVHPEKRETSFYRVRVDQSSAASGDHLRIAVFKIFNEDQHGLLLSDNTQPINPWTSLTDCKVRDDCDPNKYTVNCMLDKCVPTGCLGCTKVAPFDSARKQNLRILIDFRDVNGVPTWDVKIVDPANTSTVFLEQKNIQDTTPNPHLYAGMVGLAHFDLETYFDDFYVKRTR